MEQDKAKDIFDFALRRRQRLPHGKLSFKFRKPDAVVPGSEVNSMLVPRFSRTVSIISDDRIAISRHNRVGKMRKGDIELSGGANRRTKNSRTYVVRANGSVVAGSGSAWSSRGNTEIVPGDTVGTAGPKTVACAAHVDVHYADSKQPGGCSGCG